MIFNLIIIISFTIISITERKVMKGKQNKNINKTKQQKNSKNIHDKINQNKYGLSLISKLIL